MDFLMGVVFFIAGVVATVLILANKRKKWLQKPFGGEAKAPWMTRQQLLVLESIAKTGRAGIRLWFTDISRSTIRSLAKRGFVDTRSGGRIVATRSGKKRLNQPWPSGPSTGDQKETGSTSGSNVSAIAPEASGAASQHDSLT